MAILGFETLSEARRGFDWSLRWNLFDGDRDSFNITHECVDRHVKSAAADRVAVRIVRSDGEYETYGFEQLSELSSKFANALAKAGIDQGDAVVMLLDPGLAYLVTFFGTLKRGAVLVPASTVVSVDSIVNYRVADAGAKLIVVESELAEELRRAGLPTGCKVLTADEVLPWIIAESGDHRSLTHPSDPALYVYSSGTTGRPKKTVLAHKSITTYAVVVGSWVLDLKPADRYMTAYSAGWLGGYGWGLCVPLSLGVAAGLYSGPFDANVFRQALIDLGITALHCTPTAYRRLLSTKGKHRKRIVKLAYTGEAMEPDLARAIADRYGSLPRGQYGATEVGFVAVDYAYPDYEIRLGSVGQPLIGTRVLVVDDNDRPLASGQLGWVGVQQATRVARVGDKGWIDSDGYVWFKGRGDDVIISAGYTIGAQEVEEVLRRHPAVADVAVVGKSDPTRGNVVKAFIQLQEAWRPEESLRRELMEYVRSHLGKHAYPRDVAFVKEFERSDGGKINRAALRDRT